MTKAAERNRRYRARKRGEDVPLRRRGWAPDEDEKLRALYADFVRGDGKFAALAKELNRNPDSLQERAYVLGLTRQNRKLSQKMRDDVSKRQVARLATGTQAFERVRGRHMGKSTAGHREDLGGRYFRSRWEANYARFLNYSGTKWDYEVKTFWFEKIKRGVRSYTPDFYLPAEDVFHEVKGWMDKKSATKLKRMRIYHPKVKVHVIGKEFFASATKQGLCRIIPGWECDHKTH